MKICTGKEADHTMISFICCLLIILLSCSRKPERTDSNLWEISGTGLNNESHIFGSIHMIPRDRASTRSEVIRILESCEIVVFEINLDSVRNSTVGTVNTYLSPEERNELRCFLKDSFNLENTVIDSLYRFNALMFGTVLIRLYFGDLFYPDYHYHEMAKKMNKRMHYLDSYSELTGVQKEAVKDLWYRSDSSRNRYISDLDRLFDFYNLERGSSVDSFMRYDIHSDRTLAEMKNCEWFPDIDSLIKENKTLIIIGSGHLGGDTGFLKLLKDNGRKVRPI